MGALRVGLSTLPVFLLLAWAAWLPRGAQEHAAGLAAGRIPLDQAREWPLQFEPSLVAGRMMLEQGGYPQEQVRAHLQSAIDRRPAYAPAYLDLAELELQVGHRDEAISLARRAESLWPTRHRQLWRLFQFYLRVGDDDEALRTLGAGVLQDHRRVEPAIISLLKLGIDVDVIVDTLANLSRDDMDRFGRVSGAVLRTAARYRHVELLELWWSAMPRTLREDEASSQRVVDLAVKLLIPDLICAAHASRFRGEPCFDRLRDEQLEKPYGSDRLHWQVDTGSGFQVRPPRGRHGTRIVFDGTENVDFRHLTQSVPLSGAGRYTLQARTSGDELDADRGVQVEARLLCGGRGATFRTRERLGSWHLQEDAVSFEVPSDCPLLRVTVVRDRSDDRRDRVSGTVELHQLSLGHSGGFGP